MRPVTQPPAKRLAPVFKPAQITVQIDENESQVEITKAHATYPDGLPGTITYVLHKGDPSLFSVSSYSGSINLLRPLDAEANSTVNIQVSTSEVRSDLWNTWNSDRFQAQTMEVDPKLAHFVSITINVADKNDWIPNFESGSYEFDVKEDTLPGTIVGQVNAFDQDRDVRVTVASSLSLIFVPGPEQPNSLSINVCRRSRSSFQCELWERIDHFGQAYRRVCRGEDHVENRGSW